MPRPDAGILTWSEWTRWLRPEPGRPMSTRAARIGPAALERFLDAIHDLSDGPTAPDDTRYLRASNELDRAAPETAADQPGPTARRD